MNPSDLLLRLVLGALLGATGQGIRVAVGLKKLSDQQALQETPAPISMSRLGVSLLIGAVAGVLASAFLTEGAWDSVRIAGLLSAGYAGTDAIESFFHRALSNATRMPALPNNTPLALTDANASQPPPVG